jgi:uncharacterized protein YdeI (YjbR/CyaY-like superfamily)
MDANRMTGRKSTVTFRVTLERAGTGPRWVIARVPVDLKKQWPQWRTRRVCGSVNGFAFKTTLIPGPKGQGYTLLVNKRMQTGAGAGPGERVQVVLKPDTGPQIIVEPKELSAALGQDRSLRRWFDQMSPSMRKGFAQLVDQAKGAETRTKRAEQMVETLMLAMEGEQEPPPILRVQFERQPLAGAGWWAMTPGQRRRHLLGIFYPQTVQGRERRAAAAVQQCLRTAQRKVRLRHEP